ncbi:hypothetical protein DRE_03495 [Drechslerella stenobrocha 248]|uniref:Ubiquitin-like domain-containing protein n=1 Tax=Drechslerella stenobrocha 248 TaxID=1043628 RepID=W7HST3_9PEZI|nr:hypothetical protein DRE_03495 [Drechslerella stenobrocha 248]
MASPVAGQTAPSGGEMRLIRIKVMKPGVTEPQTLSLDIALSSTVFDLKGRIEDATATHPDAQRIIYQGRQLADDAVLKQAFHSSLDNPNPINLHVVIRPSPETIATTVPARNFFHSGSSQPTSSTASRTATPSRTARGQAPPGANSELNNDPDPFLIGDPAHPPQAAPGGSHILSYNSHHPSEIGNSTSGGDPTQASRNTQSSVHPGRAINPPNSTPDPSIRTSPPAGTGTNQVHRRIVHTQTQTFRVTSQAHPGVPGAAPVAVGGTTYTTVHSFGTPHVAGLPGIGFSGAVPPIPSPPPQYWLLQGPDGPDSILLSSSPPPVYLPPRRSPLGPSGSHLSPPPGFSLNDSNIGLSPAQDRTPLPPQQSFVDREEALRAQLEQTRMQNMQRMAMLDQQRRQMMDMVRQAEINAALQQERYAERVQNVLHLQRPPPPPVPPRRRMNAFQQFANMFLGAGMPGQPPNQRDFEELIQAALDNVWLAMRLVFAVYLLGGGRDFRRDIVLWVSVTVIFIWQSGIFDNWLRPYLRRLNDLIPDPNQLPPPQVRPVQPDGQREPNPADLAARLVQAQQAQQQGGGILYTIQTGISIFLASLIPGLGERIGNARAAERRREQQALEATQAAAQQGQGENDGNAAAAAAGAGEGGQAQGGQAPGPQGAGIVDAARDHFGEERAGELFGPGGDRADEVQPLFGL